MGQRRRWLAIAAVVALAAGIAGWAWARAGTRPTASVETGPPPPTAAAPVLAPTPPVPPPPSPQPSSGELWVRSSPRLEVIVDDRARGRTPLRLDLPGGLHKLVLKDEDLGLHHGRQIHVAPGGSQTEQWNAAKGWVTFHAAPYAQVFWGRKALGVTPINRMPFWEGHHTFTFVDPETRHSARRQVDVVAEQESVVKVDLRE